MTKLGKLWTAGIAYVALAVGAGLSIMYNVVDTATVRGPAMDIYDLVTAIAAPGIVVLMVELFVSNWWIGTRWPMQVLRWSGCLVIGGVAMRASWTHGHDFMIGRGQTADVATTWPLAIDLLAVMATALILAGRRVRGQLPDTDIRQRVAMTAPDVATFKEKMSADTKTMSADEFASGSYVRGHATDNPWTDTYARADMATDTTVTTDMGSSYPVSADMTDTDAVDAAVRGILGDFPPAADTPIKIVDDGAVSGQVKWAQMSTDTPRSWADLVGADNRLMDWVSGQDRAHADIADTLAAEAEAHLSAVMSADTLPRRTRTPGVSYPVEFALMATAWDPDVLPRADMVKLSAAYFVVSERTVRRWLAAVLLEPVSGSPEGKN